MGYNLQQNRTGKNRKKKLLFYGLFCVLIVFLFACLEGCGVNELENQAFPLAMGVEAQDNDTMNLYLAYPNLQDEKASKNALSSDVFWEGEVSDLFAGMRQMSENSNKNPDLNHLKVLILSPKVIVREDALEAVLSFFEKETDAAWNTYVLLTEEPMQQIFSEEMQLPECMGIYLEDLLEEWEHVKDSAFVTVGTLMQQFYGAEEMMCIPKLSLQEGKLNISGFFMLYQMKIAGNLSLQEGYEALLLQNKMREYEFQMKDGTGVMVEQLKTHKVESVTPKIIVKGSFRITNRMEGNQKSQNVKVQAKRELEKRLQIFARRWQQMCTEESKKVQVFVE